MLLFEFYALKILFIEISFNAIALVHVVCCEVLVFVKIWLCDFVLRYNNLFVKITAIFHFKSVKCRCMNFQIHSRFSFIQQAW